MEMKAEEEVMCLEAEGRLGPPGAGREARNGVSLEPPEGSSPMGIWI